MWSKHTFVVPLFNFDQLDTETSLLKVLAGTSSETCGDDGKIVLFGFDYLCFLSFLLFLIFCTTILNIKCMCACVCVCVCVF